MTVQTRCRTKIGRPGIILLSRPTIVLLQFRTFYMHATFIVHCKPEWLL